MALAEDRIAANLPRVSLRSRAGTVAAPPAMTVGKLPWVPFLYLVLVATPAIFTVGPLYMTAVRAFLVVMFIPLVLRLLQGKGGPILLPDILFPLHMVWAAVALQVNNPGMMISQIGSLAPEFLGGYLIGRTYIRTREDFAALCKMVGVILLLLLPLAIIESFTKQQLLMQVFRKLPGVSSYGVGGAPQRLGLDRAKVLFHNAIHFGLYSSMGFTLTLVALKGLVPSWQRYAFGLAAGGCVFFSLSSGPLLPVIMQIFFILWALTFRSISWRWYLLIALAALAYVVVDLLSTRTPVRVFFSYATFSSHNAYWRGIIFEWGMRNVWANPIYGIGLNNWERPWFMFSGSMDNFWLVMAVRYGIPGFLLIAVGYGWGLLRVAFRDLRADPVMAQQRLAWMFTFVGVTFTLATVHVWTTAYSYVFFMYGAGMWFITAAVNGTAAAATNGRQQRPPATSTAPPDPDHTVPVPDGPVYTRFPQHQRRVPDGRTPSEGQPFS